MDGVNKPLVFCFKILKCFLIPVSRIRKVIRKSSMRQFKVAVGILGSTSCFLTVLMYYWYRASLPAHLTLRHDLNTETTKSESLIMGTPFYKPIQEPYVEKTKKNDYSFELEDRKQVPMIDTPGCEIPVAMVDYEKDLKKINKKAESCGRRAVFLKKTHGDEVQAVIKANIIKKYLRRSANYYCCYRFMRKSTEKNKKIQYTACNKLQHGATIRLETDFINIKCFEYDSRNASHIVYDDVFAFTKKINKIKSSQTTECKEKYNVLLLGMDSMSLPRIVKTMPRTTAYFKNNNWFGYRGYHKIGDNTFPNLMAVFTGQNVSSISEKCAGKMDECNDILIWSRFREAGYVTAYGEDNLRLPDTFHNSYLFRAPPTDHYMRTLFLKGETELNNNSLVCAGKVPSGRLVLDYALDFASTYRTESFFGVFWINSFSHNINSRPQDSDKMFENFFNQLTYTGVLENTFVIFFSDHGIRFGEHRFKMESFYDERMPFLFILTPTLHKARQSVKNLYASINQFRLVTPYDLYNTLIEINCMSTCSQFSGSASEACPLCQSILNHVISDNRTCEDVAIEDKWCSCHKLFPLDIKDTEGLKSIMFVIKNIKTKTKSVKTKRCWGCMSLSLKKIIRIHFYYDKHKTNLYHVIAFTMSPGNVSYEATVLRKGEKIELVGSVSIISPYRGLGKCTLQPSERLFCVCQKIDNCTGKSKS